MKPELQRVAIALHLGWGKSHHTWRSPKPAESRYARFVQRGNAMEEIPDSQILPDYLADLNAMHEAEKVLTGREIIDYVDELYKASAWPNGTDHCFDHVCATAAQRCEAFLRTLDLWKDET